MGLTRLLSRSLVFSEFPLQPYSIGSFSVGMFRAMKVITRRVRLILDMGSLHARISSTLHVNVYDGVDNQVSAKLVIVHSIRHIIYGNQYYTVGRIYLFSHRYSL